MKHHNDLSKQTNKPKLNVKGIMHHALSQEKEEIKTSELKELEPAHMTYYAHTNLNPTFDFGV